MTPLQKERLKYKPPLPKVLKNVRTVAFQPVRGGKRGEGSLRRLFPNTFDQLVHKLGRGKGISKPLCMGVVFSGGPAAGGHNVLAGLFDALKKIHPRSKLIGFLGGPSGIVENRFLELSKKEIDPYRNQGGFDRLGTGRTKIETQEQLEASLKACQGLDGLVIVGGDDSNTNAAVLAEFFLAKGCQTRVVGLPKTIDGDLQSDDIEISFGFDSACKTYSELIGNIARDALSARKYYHFIKLMGRSASHIALECALATHPNLTFIGEERKPLRQIAGEIADLICKRNEAGKDYGVILIPEGLIEFMPEMKTLIAEINQILANKGSIETNLSPASKETFSQLPEKIQKQLLFERDPHGNIPVSQIATEQLLIEAVKKELKNRPSYKGKFFAQEHFFGYEGRCCLPSNFDANYCYTLGYLAALAVRDGLTGVIGAVKNLHKSVSQWELKAVPLTHLMHLEVRSGKEKPVIRKALVDIKTKPFVSFALIRKKWEKQDLYCTPGPIQFLGKGPLCDAVPMILVK